MDEPIRPKAGTAEAVNPDGTVDVRVGSERAPLRHTPGPWRLMNRGLASARIEGANGEGVCTWARYPMDSCSDGDAALVAAAPEMAALLRELEWSGVYGGDGGRCCPVCRFDAHPKYEPATHDPECRLAALLARLPKETT